MTTLVEPTVRESSMLTANEVRLARSEMRREIRGLSTAAGRERVAQLLGNPPDFLHSLEIRILLSWIKRIYGSQVDSMLHAAGVRELHPLCRRSHGCPFQPLTERQREKIAGLLRGER